MPTFLHVKLVGRFWVVGQRNWNDIVCVWGGGGVLAAGVSEPANCMQLTLPCEHKWNQKWRDGDLAVQVPLQLLEKLPNLVLILAQLVIQGGRRHPKYVRPALLLRAQANIFETTQASRCRGSLWLMGSLKASQLCMSRNLKLHISKWV